MKCLQCVEENGCSDDYIMVTHVHLRKHEMTPKEYKNKFNLRITCDPEFVSDKKRLVASEIFKEHRENKELKKQRIEKIKTGLKKYFDNLGQDNKNKIYGKGMRDKKHSKESKEKMSESKKKIIKSLDKDTRIKIYGSGMKGKHHTDERNKKLSEKHKMSMSKLTPEERKIKFGNPGNSHYSFGKPPCIGSCKFSKGGTRKDLGQYFRSTWEANFARIMNLLRLEYKYEEEVFKLDDNGKPMTYTPDFYINGCYYEIKGYWRGSDKIKTDLFKEQYPQYSLIIIDDKEYRKLKNHFSFMILNWEFTKKDKEYKNYTKRLNIYFNGKIIEDPKIIKRY